MKKCRICLVFKPEINFHAEKNRKDGLCTTCRNCYASNRKKYRNSIKEAQNNRSNNLRRKYKMTIEDYETKLNLQDSKCYICKKTCATGNRLAVDHNRNCCDKEYTCGKCVRGLLCYRCNTHLGWYERNKMSIKNYLEK